MFTNTVLSQELAAQLKSTVKTYDADSFMSADAKQWLADKEEWLSVVHEEAPELVMDVYKFDHFYAYSDQHSTWMAGETNKGLLIDRIKASDFNEEQKAALLSGLNNPESVMNMWPILKKSHFLNNAPLSVRVYEAGYRTCDMNKLTRVLDIAKRAVESYPFAHGYVVHSKSSPENRNIAGKISIPVQTSVLYRDLYEQFTPHLQELAVMLSRTRMSGGFDMRPDSVKLDELGWASDQPNPMLVDGVLVSILEDNSGSWIPMSRTCEEIEILNNGRMPIEIRVGFKERRLDGSPYLSVSFFPRTQKQVPAAMTLTR